MTASSRRDFLAGVVGATFIWSAPAIAQEAPPPQEAPPAPGVPLTQEAPVLPPPASSFAVDWQGGPQTPETLASLDAQIALVEALRIKPEIAAFFASQGIKVDLKSNGATRASPNGIIFGRKPVPADNPVLLHELLHRYHLLKLADGYQNPVIIGFYEQAMKDPKYPANSYMYKNAIEFFGMTGSATLYGKAARSPDTRASVAANLPDFYNWIVAEFGLVVEAPPPPPV